MVDARRPHEDRLGELEVQGAAPAAVSAARRHGVSFDDVRVPQLPDREVHRDVEIRVARDLGTPAREVGAGGLEHPRADLLDQPRVLGDRDEDAGAIGPSAGGDQRNSASTPTTPSTASRGSAGSAA